MRVVAKLSTELTHDFDEELRGPVCSVFLLSLCRSWSQRAFTHGMNILDKTQRAALLHVGFPNNSTAPCAVAGFWPSPPERPLPAQDDTISLAVGAMLIVLSCLCAETHVNGQSQDLCELLDRVKRRL